MSASGMFRNYQLMREKWWILSEINHLSKLGLIGAFSFLSDAIQVKMGTIFISRTSGSEIAQEVSALFLGQTIVAMTAYVVMQGIAAGMGTLCSQAYGAKEYRLVSCYYTRALMIAALTCFPIWTILISVKPVLLYLTGNFDLAQGTGAYTTMLCFGYPGYLYSKLASGFLQSQNIILPVLIIQICGNVINVSLQYLLVVVFPFKITGVGFAYVVSTSIVSVLLYSYIRFTAVHIISFSSWSFECLSGWYHFVKYGSACVTQLLMDIIVCRIAPTVFIGLTLQDTKQFALFGMFNIVWFLFLSVSLGFGIGANVRIGNLLGECNLGRAQKATIVGICYIIMLEASFGVLIFSFAHYISYIFTSVEEMRREIEFGIRIVSICILTDSWSTVRGILNACCLQHIAIIIQLFFALLLSVPLGCVTAFYVPWRAAGYTLITGVGFLLSSSTTILILYWYNWNKIIEKVLTNTNSELSLNLTTSSAPLTYSHKLMLTLRYAVLFAAGVILLTATYLVL